ncbi:hypothetical protein SFC42_23395 [Priestia filamentosa]|uniref:hypothetical protein n=1 Tax=Priestia filamentosa TaxID=1402861 RepID=UPI00398322B0
MILAAKKTQTMSIKEFMNGGKETNPKRNRGDVKTGQEWLPLSLGMIGLPFLIESFTNIAFAAEAVPAMSTKEEVKAKVIEAFNPLIELAQGLAYPVTFITIAGAGIMWIIGRRERAMDTLQGATIGYFVVQLAPLIMKLLTSVTTGF